MRGRRILHSARPIEDRQQVGQRLIHRPEVTNVTPADGIRIVAEVVIGQLPQGC